MIKNLLTYHYAVKAVCPIAGVHDNGTIDFALTATPTQRQAGLSVLAGFQDIPFVDPNPPLPTVNAVSIAQALLRKGILSQSDLDN